MKKLLVLAAMSIAALSLSVGVASSTAATGSATTVTHYTASYSCDCFGTFTIVGVHITNKQFPGTDSGGGGGNATGGRDNFTGTVSQPPAVETVLNEANAGDWCSDYDGQCTNDWSLTIEPDGALTGWAIYPSS
jgi:hypothetical protein